MRKSSLFKICFIIIISAIILIGCLSQLSEFAILDSFLNDIKGDIVGVSFDCKFYDNNGQQFMNINGDKINMESNIVREMTSDGGYVNTISSVITITIDGQQVESCGSTVLFIEDGLTVDVDFNEESVKNIESSANEFSDNTSIASIVNKYKNSFGKSTVVVVQSQLGNPICAFSGKEVYWEVCDDLPKTTKLMIDGRALYIHRANFQIIDKSLLD